MEEESTVSIHAGTSHPSQSKLFRNVAAAHFNLNREQVQRAPETLHVAFFV